MVSSLSFSFGKVNMFRSLLERKIKDIFAAGKDMAGLYACTSLLKAK